MINENRIINLGDEVDETTELTENIKLYLEQYSQANADKLMSENSISVINELSHLRHNVIDWIDITKEDSVLEINSGYGALTSCLLKKAKSVVCTEESYDKSTVNAERNVEYDNLTIYVGELEKIAQSLAGKKFDYIIMIGALSFAEVLMKTKKNAEEKLIALAKSLLSEKGKLVISFDNKYGIKYFNGSSVNETSRPFQALEGIGNPLGEKLFSNGFVEQLLKTEGFDNVKKYYPYPDYKFTFSLYSDAYQPSIDEVNNCAFIWETQKLHLFSDKSVYNSIIEDGLFKNYSNSYLMIAEQKKSAASDKEIVYIKYSNDRRPGYRIRTDIIYGANGSKLVRKIPTCKFSVAHVQNMKKAYCALSAQLPSDEYSFNKFAENGQALDFEFVKGESLNTRLFNYIVDYNYDKLEEEFDSFYKLFDMEVLNYFIPSKKFVAVFGNPKLPVNLAAFPVNNIDLIFPNVIVSEDGTFNIIDYEWTFDFPIPCLYVIFRSIFYLFSSTHSFDAKQIQMREQLYAKYNITPELQKKFFGMEVEFHRYIEGGYTPITKYPRVEHYSLYRKPAECFLSTGTTFSANDQRDISAILGLDNLLEFDIEFTRDIQSIRIDPINQKSIIKIHEISMENVGEIKYATNGELLGDGTYYYAHRDPQVIVTNLAKLAAKSVCTCFGIYKLHVKFEITVLSSGISDSVQQRNKRKK